MKSVNALLKVADTGLSVYSTQTFFIYLAIRVVAQALDRICNSIDSAIDIYRSK